MSRAFVKEADGDDVSEDLPERVQSDAPNYITLPGLEALRTQLGTLQTKRTEINESSEHLGRKGELLRVDRDISYLKERISKAIPVEQNSANTGIIVFGSSVILEDTKGEQYEFTIIGEDESDVEKGRISWTSPLAKSLLGSALDDTIIWERQDGKLELEVCEIFYAEPE